jgi:glyoxylase-like metal-dependent hydrolase (beta-lactamase superfamily II)
MSGDERVHVFRRVYDVQGVFEGLTVDAYVVMSERYLVVLDTMLVPGDVDAMIQQVAGMHAGREGHEGHEGHGVLCVNSHADWDHAWGNAYFSGARAAPIIAHDYCRTRLQSEEARLELEEFRRLDPLFQQAQLVPPSITFSESMTIDGGDLTIELLSAPGHQLDEIAAWIPELRLLLAFDAVEHPLPLIEGPRGVPLMLATLERLVALQPRRVLCSHGNTTGPQLVQANQAYVREVERRCRAYLREHHPAEEEIARGSQLIAYPCDEVMAGVTGEIDHTFYSQAHEENVVAMLRWLMNPP